MGLMAEPDAPPPLCRGGQGDHATSLNILAATLAALRLRDTTGKGQHVELTLQASGMWTIAGDHAANLVARGPQPPRISRKNPINPMWNSYQCGDGLWMLLVNPVTVSWPKFARAIGRPDWAERPEYNDVFGLRAASAELTAQVEPIIAGQSRAHWGQVFDDAGLIWAPVATMPDMAADPQVREMGWYATIDHPEYGSFETLDTPFKIYGSDTGVRGPAPDLGQHTFDVLAELGIEGDRLNALAASGAIG
jgi:formyl-CoA transferase